MENHFLKKIIFFIFSLLYSIPSLIAEDNFRHPLVVESGDLYRFVRMDYSHTEEKTPDLYERTRSLNLSAEYSFYKYFALTARTGNSMYEKTDSATIRRNERMSAGVKIAHIWKDKFLTGFYIKGYGTNKTVPQRAGENLNLFLIESGFSFGYKFKGFEILANLFIQSETNYILKEEFGQQFRRFYQAEVSVSRNMTKQLSLFLETSYRFPYNKEIDHDSLFWYFYPGISIKSSYGTMGISPQIPVSSIGKQERGGKISYFYFF